jgi:hypothetical protein
MNRKPVRSDVCRTVHLAAAAAERNGMLFGHETCSLIGVLLMIKGQIVPRMKPRST